MNYISSANQQALAARYRLTALIVGALGVSTVLYVVIGWVFAPAMPRGEYDWLNPNVIGVFVLVMVALVMFVRHWWLSSTRLENLTTQGAGAILSSFYLASLVGAVLGDLVGIVGVVVSLLSGVREYSWRLGIAALLLIAYSFPRRNEWTRAMARAEAKKDERLEPQTGSSPPDAIRLGLSDPE